jgi:hypothetical protein
MADKKKGGNDEDKEWSDAILNKCLSELKNKYLPHLPLLECFRN